MSPTCESPSDPRLPGRSRSRLRSESREPRGARSESRGSSTSRAENEIVSSLENDREKRSPCGSEARMAKMSAVSEAFFDEFRVTSWRFRGEQNASETASYCVHPRFTSLSA